MTTKKWQNITDYMDTVGTTLKTFTFNKTQNLVKVTIRGNANVTYAIGSQSGTLTPGQSITVSELITSFNLTAVSGTQTVEVWAIEDGTEKVEDNGNSLDDVVASLFEKSPRPVIWDTDWWTDVDDVVAGRILLWAEQAGMVDIVCVGMSACMSYSVSSLDAFFWAEGRRGMTIGIDSAATDFGGTPPYQANMANNPNDYQSNSNAEDVIRMYRRALANSTDQIDFIATGYPQTLANLLKSPADDISSLTGLQLFSQKVRKVWMMAGKYPSGSENNFNRNTRAIQGGSYFVANCPVPITFLGWEVGSTVITGGNLSSIFSTSDDVLTKALSDYGLPSGRSSWDPMTVLMACYGDETMAGYLTVKGTNSVDATTGTNTFTLNNNGNHAYVVKLQTDTWYKNIINSILTKSSWRTRKVGGKQLQKLPITPNTSPLTVSASVVGGTYTSVQTVSLTANKWAIIFYTLDGSTPTTASSIYRGPFTVSSTSTLQFFGVDGLNNMSTTQSISYTINLPPLMAQWIASDLSANADGTTINSWSDHSGSGNNLTSPSSSQYPTFKANIGGKNAVQFNGSNSQLATTGNVNMPANMTVYMKVWIDTAPTANNTIISQDTGGGTTPIARLWHETLTTSGFNAIGFSGSGGSPTGLTASDTVTVSTGAWHTIVAVHTPTSIQPYFDGAAGTALTVSSPNTGSTKINVGGTYNASSTWAEPFKGSVAEIRVYAAAHDATTISTISSQLE